MSHFFDCLDNELDELYALSEKVEEVLIRLAYENGSEDLQYILECEDILTDAKKTMDSRLRGKTILLTDDRKKAISHITHAYNLSAAIIGNVLANVLDSVCLEKELPEYVQIASDYVLKKHIINARHQDEVEIDLSILVPYLQYSQ